MNFNQYLNCCVLLEKKMVTLLKKAIQVICSCVLIAMSSLSASSWLSLLERRLWVCVMRNIIGLSPGSPVTFYQ